MKNKNKINPSFSGDNLNFITINKLRKYKFYLDYACQKTYAYQDQTYGQIREVLLNLEQFDDEIKKLRDKLSGICLKKIIDEVNKK